MFIVTMFFSIPGHEIFVLVNVNDPFLNGLGRLLQPNKNRYLTKTMTPLWFSNLLPSNCNK